MTPAPRRRKPCVICGTPSTASRCPEHAIPQPTAADRKRRASVIAEHLAIYGPNCPGYGTEAHAATDLTADHVLPRSRFGESGDLTVLCRACNARKHNGGRSR